MEELIGPGSETLGTQTEAYSLENQDKMSPWAWTRAKPPEWSKRLSTAWRTANLGTKKAVLTKELWFLVVRLRQLF